MYKKACIHIIERVSNLSNLSLFPNVYYKLIIIKITRKKK